MYTGGVLEYTKAGTDKKGNQLYEALVNLEFDYRTSGEGARIGVKPVNTTMEVKTNVFFTRDEEGNYISTGFKASK